MEMQRSEPSSFLPVEKIRADWLCGAALFFDVSAFSRLA
jgi:hypothetical protein